MHSTLFHIPTIAPRHRPVALALAILGLALLILPAAQRPAEAASPIPDSPARVAQPGCEYEWFFGAQARPVDACPDTPPISTALARLEFERGEMIWVQAEQAIYVLFRDFQAPYWASYPDTFLEGTPEREAGLVGPLGLWQQPRRGFGQLWRTTPTVRDRLGWALREWEDAYTATIQQTGAQGGGTIYLTGPDGQIYALTGDRSRWERFAP